MRKVYVDAESLEYDFIPREDTEFIFIQTEDRCKVRINIRPFSNQKFKIKVYIYAEGTAEVDCVCTLNVDKDVSGVETDIQFRSWPFDKSKIKARPEMFISNSNVIATHGNAIGTISDEQTFYLALRGISNYKQLIKESLLNA
jgi:hypothetical protein